MNAEATALMRSLPVFRGWRSTVSGESAGPLFLTWLFGELGADADLSRNELLHRLGQLDPAAPAGGRFELLGPGGRRYSCTFTATSGDLEGGSDLAAWAWGGLASMSGEPDGPPVAPGAPLASLASALHAAVAFGAAHAGGVVEVALEINLSDVVASMLEIAGLKYAVDGTIRERGGDWWGLAGWGLYDCADARVAIALRDVEQLHALARVLDQPALTSDDFSDFMWGLCERADEANALLLSALIDRQADDVVAALRSERIAASKVKTLDELLRDQHLLQRGALEPLGEVVLPAPPFLLNRPQQPVARPPAEDPERPLAGVRVLDMSSVWSGPMAARLLADLGASVTKIVRPGVRVGHHTSDGEWDRDFYAILNDRNKRCVYVDLADDSDRAWLAEQVRQSDVLIENFGPGSLDRSGFGHRRLLELNPRLVVVSMPAMGLSGPEADAVGYGSTIEQAAGIGWLYADDSGVPHRSGINFSDPIAGLFGALAATLGLSSSRESCLIELSQQEASLALMMPSLLAYQQRGEKPRARAASYTNDTWTFPLNSQRPGSRVRVRDTAEVVGTPGAPGSAAIEWVGHPDGIEYPLVRLPWRGSFADAVSLEPVEQPRSVAEVDA